MADRLRVVLDTNVLLVSISSRSPYHWIFQRLLEGHYELIFSNEILLEYEEIIGQKFSVQVAGDVVRALLLLPQARQIEPYFNWSLIQQDPDDNKFIDCAVAGNASVLVTEDRHFNVLDGIDFPKVRRAGIEAFERLLDGL